MHGDRTRNGAVLEDISPDASVDDARMRPGTVDRDAVLHQLERLLASPPFRTSKRYPRFLRYVVEETLGGRSEGVKERVIAVAVFDRSPDFDSNIDPIVRVAAGDIRKRLAQYYVQPDHESELRIDLLSGSYVPTFFWPDRHLPTPASELEDASKRPVDAEPEPEAAPSKIQVLAPERTSRRAFVVLVVGVLLSALGITSYLKTRPQANLRAFWAPMSSDSRPSLILLADILSVSDQSEPTVTSDPSIHDWIMGANHVAYGDVAALTNLAGEFQRQGAAFRVLMASSVEFSQLREQPLVLIGGGDNFWAKRFQTGLRYTFNGGPETQALWIKDEKFPDQRRWNLKFSDRLTSFTRDFGIVTRITNTSIEQPTLMITGLGPYATAAAGEFITNPQYFREFTRLAPKDWAHKNLQIVIETEVVNGQSGPPHMVAYYVW